MAEEETAEKTPTVDHKADEVKYKAPVGAPWPLSRRIINMLEVGWSEILVIALILIIVVGPKGPCLECSGHLEHGEPRARFGQRVPFPIRRSSARRRSSDDVRKGLSEVNKLNPTNSLRDAINPIRKLGEDIKSDLRKATEFKDEASSSTETPVVGEDKPEDAAPASNPVLEPVAKLAPAPAETQPTEVKAPRLRRLPSCSRRRRLPWSSPSRFRRGGGKSAPVVQDAKPKAKRASKPKTEKAEGESEPVKKPRAPPQDRRQGRNVASDARSRERSREENRRDR